MFDPKYNIKPHESTPSPESAKSPVAPPVKKKEEPSPSQVGQFLGALDRTKQEKKLNTDPSLEESLSAIADMDEEGESGGLFGLVAGQAKGKMKKFESATDQKGSDDTPSGGTPFGMFASSIAQPAPISMPEPKAVSYPASPAKKEPDESAPQPELSMVPPEAPKTAVFSDPGVRAETTPHPSSAAFERVQAIESLISTMAQEITTLKTKELTAVQITLKHPPLLAGAVVTIQEYSSAKNEFNVTFSDLSPDARRLLESVQAQDLLQTRLLERGYTLRIVTIEASIRLSDSPATGEGAQRERGTAKEKQEQNPKKFY